MQTTEKSLAETREKAQKMAEEEKKKKALKEDSKFDFFFDIFCYLTVVLSVWSDVRNKYLSNFWYCYRGIARLLADYLQRLFR